MEKVIVSVIIPVYKTEKYLSECIESVLEQDYPYLDIILVDDGSPDGCPKICDRYAAECGNVRVIHKKNEGLGKARNTGTDHAYGQYLMFLDSDDKLDGTRAVSSLVACAERNRADIVVGGFRRFYDNWVSEVNIHHLMDGDYTQTVDFRFRGFFQYGHLAYDWGKLYRRDFLLKHGLYSPNYPFTQDKAHNFLCCAWKPIYGFIDESVVQYRVNTDSTTFSYKKNFIPVWTDIAADFQTYLKEHEIREDYGDLMAFHIVFGSFFLIKQELQAAKSHGIHRCSKALQEYAQVPIVRQSMRWLAQGRYVGQITPKSWKVMIRGTAILFQMHAWSVLAAGMALVRKMGVDDRVSKSRYRKEEAGE